MDYYRIYNSLVNQARFQCRKKLKRTDSDFVYYENHHILPKCLGGTNDKENMVLLTAREHFIAHRLLCKIFLFNYSLKRAVLYMAQRKRSRNFLDEYTPKYFRSSREYEKMRLEVAEYRMRSENSRIFINNGILNKVICMKELSYYLDQGWIRGKLSKSTRKRIFVHKQNIRREIDPKLKEYYLKAGWKLGNYNKAKALLHAEFDVSYVWISNGEERHLIGKDALPYALADGWRNVSRIGKPKGYSKNRVAIQKEGLVKYIDRTVLHLWHKAGWEESFAVEKGNLKGTKYQGIHYVSKDEICYCVSADVLPFFIEEGWTEEKPKSMYDSRRGKDTVFINNGVKCKRVPVRDLSIFLKQGWSLGRINRSSIITIGKEGYLKQIDVHYLSIWEKAGWSRVINPKKTKHLKDSPYRGLHKIYKGEIELTISSDVLPFFLEEGWNLGRIS